MGWYCVITADRELKIEDIQSVIDELPPGYRGFGLQKWGWSAACDVRFPEKNTVMIGGSHDISGALAKPFVRYFTKKLKEKGFVVRRKWYW